MVSGGKASTLRLPFIIRLAVGLHVLVAGASASKAAPSSPPPMPSRHLRAGLAAPVAASLVSPHRKPLLPATRHFAAVADALESEENTTCLSRARVALTACDFGNHQRVEWAYGDGDSAESCGDEALPEAVSIKCDHVAWWSGEGVAVVLLAAIGFGVALLFWLALSKYRRSRTVRLAQPALCMAFVAGTAVSCLASLALLGENTDMWCSMRLWLWSAGFDVAFGAMALKLWRVLSVVEGSLKFRRVHMTNRRVHMFLGLLVFGDAAILTSWTASIGGHCVSSYIEAAGAVVPRASCISCCHAHFFVWVGLKVAMVMFCCYISYRTRRIQASKAESGAMAMATYNMILAALLVAAVSWADADVQVHVTSEAVAIALVGVGSLCTILAPRLLVAKEELENKALIGPYSGGGSSDGEAESATLAGVTRLRVRAGRVGGSGGVSCASVGDDTPRAGDCDCANPDGPNASGVFAVIPGSTGRKRTPARGAAAPVVPIGMLGTPPLCGRVATPCSRAPPLSATSLGAKTPTWGRSDSSGGVGGSSGGRGDGRRGRATPLASAFCTPPPRVKRSRSAGANSLVEKHISRGVFLSGGELIQSGHAKASSSSSKSKSRALLTAASFLGERRLMARKAAALASSGGRSRGGGRKGLSRKGLSRKSSSSSRPLRQSSSSIYGGNFSTPSTPASTVTDQLRRRDSSSGGIVTRDTWPLDPITLAMNGETEGLYSGGVMRESGGSTSASAATQESRQSKHSKHSHLSGAFGAAKRTLSRRTSSGCSIRSGRWRDREGTASSVSSGSKPGGGVRRSSAAGSLKMFADSGTRLFCPHCEQEVAGCGFKGCSGSLVRAPSCSDDEGTNFSYRTSRSVPPLRRPYSGSSGGKGGSSGSGSGSRSRRGERSRLEGSGATTISRSIASLSGVSAATTVGVSSSASATGASASASPPPGRPHRLRLSFGRGRSACDTFDTDDDSTDDDDDDDDDGGDGRRGKIRGMSGTSSDNWLVV